MRAGARDFDSEKEGTTRTYRRFEPTDQPATKQLPSLQTQRPSVRPLARTDGQTYGSTDRPTDGPAGSDQPTKGEKGKTAAAAAAAPAPVLRRVSQSTSWLLTQSELQTDEQTDRAMTAFLFRFSLPPVTRLNYKH